MNPSVFRLRVVIDHEEDVFRDIEIRSDQTFEVLHGAIQQAFEFDNSQMASFFLSNATWEKGQEVALFDMDDERSENLILTMHQTTLGQLIAAKSDRLLYVFDFLLMWCFYLEVVEVNTLPAGVDYPRLVQYFGDAPDQYSKAKDDDLENMALSNLAEQLKDLDYFDPDQEAPESEDNAS
ncbi:MAG: hypothetical protein ACFB10_25205 [Salibacteraceae bacterium]